MSIIEILMTVVITIFGGLLVSILGRRLVSIGTRVRQKGGSAWRWMVDKSGMQTRFDRFRWIMRYRRPYRHSATRFSPIHAEGTRVKTTACLLMT